jgi:hypothetical protein
MIRTSISCRSKNGASHRKNLDTPSLEGLRLEPERFHLVPHGNIKTSAYSAISTVPFGTVIAYAKKGQTNDR